MNPNHQETAPPRVSILVDAGGGRIGSTSSTSDGIGRLFVSDDTNPAQPAVGGGGGGGEMSPGSDDMSVSVVVVGGGGGGRPTAIPADEGDVSSRATATTVGGGAIDATTTTAANFDDNGNAVEGGRGGGTLGDDDDMADEDVVDDDVDVDDEDDEDDESDYSYAYEDDDEGHYSGFLIPTDPFETSASATAFPPAVAGGDDDRVNVVVAEDFAAAVAGGGGGSDAAASSSAAVGPSLPESIHSRTVSRATSLSGEYCPPHPAPSSHPETTKPRDEERKQKWREPTRAAVNMSLRAEKEKTGGKRRLASDLYKIMMADTQEAGFSLQPCDEDSMDKWCIKLFGFDEDSNLAKDLVVCGNEHVELEMSFPDQYPFEPPFVRVVKPRFKRQTGFVMSGALCMELLTKDGWNPINDIESVIVSIRSLMVVGDGRLQAAVDMTEGDYAKVLKSALEKSKLQKSEAKDESTDVDEEEVGDVKAGEAKRKRASSNDADRADSKSKVSGAVRKPTGGSYTTAEAQSAYDHLSKYHKQEGWDKSGWWTRKG